MFSLVCNVSVLAVGFRGSVWRTGSSAPEDEEEPVGSQ